MDIKSISEKQYPAMARVCLDLHEALGVKWGDDPYAKIRFYEAALKAAVARVEYHKELCKPGVWSAIMTLPAEAEFAALVDKKEVEDEG